eukprot:TRINITY_DN5768_c0_g1_i1.p1 TRINITY_DN5768_c0_g1~~TRINITY_DN5768_c0_g1_i1.p1  ORF type:complete len:122 (-),score=33.91 TRINITY_DN5768_c0_g1_i1:58-423(-)
MAYEIIPAFTAVFAGLTAISALRPITAKYLCNVPEYADVSLRDIFSQARIPLSTHQYLMDLEMNLPEEPYLFGTHVITTRVRPEFCTKYAPNPYKNPTKMIWINHVSPGGVPLSENPEKSA